MTAKRIFKYKKNGTIYTLCAKLAFNNNDSQCDYDIDWTMAWNDVGYIYDTDMAVTKDDSDWYNDSAERIIKECNNGELEYKS